MIKNVINCKESEFVPGRTFRATVKAAHREGVLIDMPGVRGSGIISPRCWGASHEREKAFAAIHAGDELNVKDNKSVCGIAHAIVVDVDSGQTEVVPGTPSSESSAAASAVAPVDVHVDALSAESDIFGRRGGLFAIAGERVRRGDVRGAVRIYAKVARRDPSAYSALAEMYREGSGGCADIKKAVRYERLARAAEKSRRECSLRERRLRAESIRGGERDFGHFSAKRRKALDLAVFASRHEMICEYRKLKRARRGWGRVYGRAA